MSSKTDVYLGFANELEPNELFSLKRQYLPLGKIGGKPSWLNPTNIPEISQLTCSVCKRQMILLVQVYCTDKMDPLHAFHRTLYVFMCRNAECCRVNDASNFVVFRNQLPRVNNFFDSDSAMDPWLVGDVPDPFYNESTFAKLCVICGCRAGKKCSRCEQRWYCCRDHQLIDWNAHKIHCGKTAIIKNNEDNMGCVENALLLKEFAIEMDLERNANNNHEELENGKELPSDDDEGGSEADPNEMTARLQQLMKYQSLDNGISLKDLEHFKESAKDTLFKNFHQVIRKSPEQILRYQRHAEPLLATDHSSKPEKVPNCELCGAERHFEFQLMPHLLSLIEVDSLSHSIDWATLIIYSCSKSCKIENDGYAKEFLFKQDFVECVEETDNNAKIQ